MFPVKVTRFVIFKAGFASKKGVLSLLHGLCFTEASIDNLNSNGNDIRVIQLLAKQAIRPFDEGYSQAMRRKALHDQFLKLKRKKHRVKLAGRFIVIEGGSNKNQPRSSS